MRSVQVESFNGGREEWERLGYLNFLTNIFDAPGIRMTMGSSTRIREHVSQALINDGWATPFPIPGISQLEITAKKNSMGFQIQTGNVSRYAYDLLKMQTVFMSEQISCACLAVPSASAAREIGGNLANSSRIIEELRTFSKFINVPLLVLAFDS